MSAENDLRRSKPGKAKRADHDGGRAAAVELNCEVCAGSLKQAADCSIQRCFLWPYRPGDGPKVRDAGVVPTPEEYAAMLPALSDMERFEIRERFAAGRKETP